MSYAKGTYLSCTRNGEIRKKLNESCTVGKTSSYFRLVELKSISFDSFYVGTESSID